LQNRIAPFPKRPPRRRGEFEQHSRRAQIIHRGARGERGEESKYVFSIEFLGALGVLAVKNLITARFAQDAKSAKKKRILSQRSQAKRADFGEPSRAVRLNFPD
jgi:hypothetical protein